MHIEIKDTDIRPGDLIITWKSVSGDNIDLTLSELVIAVDRVHKIYNVLCATSGQLLEFSCDRNMHYVVLRLKPQPDCSAQCGARNK